MDRFLDVAQLSPPAKAASGEIDVQDIVFSHIQRRLYMAYHGMERTKIAIPLPYLGKSEERMGFIPVIPSTSRPDLCNYYIAGKVGRHAGKVVEEQCRRRGSPDGFSLTKNVCGLLLLSCGLLLSSFSEPPVGIKDARNEGAGRIYRIDGNGHQKEGRSKRRSEKKKPSSSYWGGGLLTVFSLS